MDYRTSAAASPLVYVAFNGHVVAMRRETGERVWIHSGRAAGPVRVLVEGDFVYVLDTGSLACLATTTGRVLWQAECACTAHVWTLLVHDGYVFVGGNGEVRCFSALDGAAVWADGFAGMGHGPVAIAVDGASAQAETTG